MRVLELLEGDVVPFRPRAAVSEPMAEPDDTTSDVPNVANLQVAQNQKIANSPEMKGTIGRAKFNAAVKQQQGGPQTVSDLAREIVLRNWDKIVTQQPLPDEDRNTLNTIVKASHYFNFWKLEDQIRDAAQKAGQASGSKWPAFSLLNPNARQAYVNDDPTYNTYRLEFPDGRVQPYNSQRERDIAAIGMLDPNLFDTADLESITKTLMSSTPEQDADMAFDNSPFDPEHREYDFEMLPKYERLEKTLAKMAKQHDKSFFILPGTGPTRDGQGWTLEMYDNNVEIAGAEDEGLDFGTAVLLHQEFTRIEDIEAYLEQHGAELQQMITTRYRKVYGENWWEDEPQLINLGPMTNTTG